MTEAEAKTKWCPMVRTGAYTDKGPLVPVTVNRDPRDEIQSSCNCIASGCMMWRWDVNRSEGGCGLAHPMSF